MNDPDALNDNLEELQQSLPAQAVDGNIQDAGLQEPADDFDILVNFDEEDEPLQRATGELELPSPVDCLDTYQAMMLYNFLCSQANAPQLVFKPAEENVPHLYDWFVSSLNVCPLVDLLDQLIKKLVAWKKYTTSLGEDVDEEQLAEMNIRESIDWDEFPGLRA